MYSDDCVYKVPWIVGLCVEEKHVRLLRKYSYIFASADLNKLQTKRFQNVYIPSSVSSRLFQCSYPITLLSFAEYLQKATKWCQTNFFVLSLKSDLNPKFNWFHDRAFLCSNVYLIFLNHKLHFFLHQPWHFPDVWLSCSQSFWEQSRHGILGIEVYIFV